MKRIAGVFGCLLAACTGSGIGGRDHGTEPMRVAHVHADADADPRWRDASESLERLSERCDDRLEVLERRESSARTASGVAGAIAVVVTIIAELSDTDGPYDGVILGEARCRAPAGPTSTLSPAEQEGAIPCGGMASAGGGGPIAQRAIRVQLTRAQLEGAMRREITSAAEWLDQRRELAEWSDEDAEAWEVHDANLRSLCLE